MYKSRPIRRFRGLEQTSVCPDFQHRSRPAEPSPDSPPPPCPFAPGAAADAAKASAKAPAKGVPLGSATLPVNTMPEETWRDFTVLDDGGVLFALDDECRLHSPEAEDGIVPGEAAAFVALALPEGQGDRRERRLPPALGLLLAAGSALDETVGTDEPKLSLAMTRLVRSVAGAAGEPPIPWVLSDVNGERHRLREWTMVANRGSLRPGATHSRLIDDLSDLGAALGPVLLAIAAHAFRSGHAPAHSAAITLQSEGPERGAFLLEEAEAPPRSERAPRSSAGGDHARSPAARLCSAARDAVEQALLRLPELPPKLDRAPIVAAAEAALGALATLAASDVDDDYDATRFAAQEPWSDRDRSCKTLFVVMPLALRPRFALTADADPGGTACPALVESMGCDK